MAYLILSLFQQSNQHNGFQITEGCNGATITVVAHKGAAKNHLLIDGKKATILQSN